VAPRNCAKLRINRFAWGLHAMPSAFSKSLPAVVLLLAAAQALAASPGHAQSRERYTGASHPEQLLQRSAQARRAWHAAVPPDLRRQAWLYGLHGTAGQISIIRVGRHRYLTGNVCKPHDCGPNSAAWLISLDHSRAAGAIDLNPDRRHGPRHFRLFGNPTEAEREQLLASLYAGR
jgi:hypothetical protein